MIQDTLSALRQSQKRIEKELDWMREAIRSIETAVARNHAEVTGALERIPQSAAWEEDALMDARRSAGMDYLVDEGEATTAIDKNDARRNREHRIEDDPVLDGAANYLADKSEGRY